MRRTVARTRRAVAAATGSAAVVTSPLTLITSVPVSQWVRGDNVVIATGVGTWTDLSGNARHFSEVTGANQPTYTAADATLNNQPTLTFDGISQRLTSTWTRTAPGTTPHFISAIIKLIVYTNNRVPIGDKTASVFNIRPNPADPAWLQFDTTGVNSNSALATGSWGRTEASFTNSNSDYLKMKATKVTGANAGNTAGTGTHLGSNAGITLFCNFAIAELVICSGTPTAAEITALDAYYTARYGAGLV